MNSTMTLLQPDTTGASEQENPEQRTLTSRREVFAVIFTGAAHLFCEEILEVKWLFMFVAFTAWGSYLARKIYQERTLLQQWGFRWEHLGISLSVAGGVFLIGAAGIAGIAHAQGTFSFHWHLFPLFVVYPAWGLIQQFLLQALITRNLIIGAPWLRSAWRVTLIAALLFAVAHWPDRILMEATFLLGLAFTPIYLRWRNLWPLGLFHGWLGTVTYFWLLGRDPWLELLG